MPPSAAVLTTDDLPPVKDGVERHVLQPESELRLEIPASSQANAKLCTLTLCRGSCELWGLELALQHPYVLTAGAKLALFTWHGCVVDVESESLELSYVSDETNANVAYVNTHAQLEALRDEALATQGTGPRVLIVGPNESGKSSLARLLVAYGTLVDRF